METDIQIIEDEGDDELAIFSGGADPRAVEDSKRLKLFKKILSAGLMMSRVASSIKMAG
jgi:hypothetical protein